MLGAVAITVVVVRLIFKAFFSTAKELKPDDTVILCALPLRITGMVLNVRGLVMNGLGRDAWTLAPDTISSFAKNVYIMATFYFAELTMIKLSLLLFYLHIFPGVTVQRLLKVTIAFNVLSGLAFIITSIFNCTPVPYIWTRFLDESKHGRCNDINAFTWATAGISIAQDMWMLSLPLFQIHRLQLHWKKKIGVIIMLLLGALCVSSR